VEFLKAKRLKGGRADTGQEEKWKDEKAERRKEGMVRT